MSIQEEKLAEIADAIRSKDGTTAPIVANDFAQRILDIPTGTDLPELTNPGVASDLLVNKQLIDQNGNIVNGSMPSVTQATPSISVSSSGLITASATQSGGKVTTGTKSATKQMTTKGATTITPTNTEQIAVSAGTYVTGDIKVGAASGGSTEVEDAIVTCTLTEYTNNRVALFGRYIFFRFTQLKTVSSTSVESILISAFNGCSSLTKADFSALKTIDSSVFNACSKLATLILRDASGVCSLNSTGVFNSTPIASGTGYIYVPSSLVDDYKAATNWSTYANQIRAIEDYPDITGG